MMKKYEAYTSRARLAIVFYKVYNKYQISVFLTEKRCKLIFFE